MAPGNGKDVNDAPNPQVGSYLYQLEALIRHGRELRERLASDPTSVSNLAATRLWQEHCGVTINQLSGGSKAHWLSRAFSEAFLMRSPSGRALEVVGPEVIVDRLLDVLAQGVTSLSRTDVSPIVSTASAQPAPRRFEFVHNSTLRPVLEQAYSDGKHALDNGDFDLALRTFCGILEAIVTDALEHKGLVVLANQDASSGTIADWPFETRLAVAEKTGLIRGGWMRLTEVARKYRETDSTAITENDARRASQVLNVILRDLNPGR